MSGTSADGLDIVLCDVDVRRRSLRNVLSSFSPYPDILRNKLLTIAQAATADMRELVAMSYYLGHFYARCIERFCSDGGISPTAVDLVGSHGQTVAHLSQPYPILGRRFRGTLQIGEAEIIAKQLGIVTISDFRSGDVALGGSGAPLVPLYHQHRFAEPNFLRAVVNIGGIANVTLLAGTDRIAATDTGPGNCLIDGCLETFYGRTHDVDGEIALSGRTNVDLLERLRRDPILNRPLPTTYDRREMFELAERHGVFAPRREIDEADIITTVSELTAVTIAAAVVGLSGGVVPDQLLICGGGVFNKYVVSRLRQRFGSERVVSTADRGSDPAYVEAEAFAYLANLALEGEVASVPAATGASRPSILGKISQP